MAAVLAGEGGQMKNLFDSAVVEEAKQRVLRLQPESERQWGRMEVASALAHCSSALEMAMGKIDAKRAPFPASLLGPLIKPLVFRDDKPIRRNAPSSPELLRANATPCDFMGEQSRLVAALEGFAKGGPAACTTRPHPFFGSLNPQQWAILMYKHTDHHLRQFGV